MTESRCASALRAAFGARAQIALPRVRASAPRARATLIGKAFLHDLGAMGECGVTSALEPTRKELDMSMALTGTRDVREIDRTSAREG